MKLQAVTVKVGADAGPDQRSVGVWEDLETRRLYWDEAGEKPVKEGELTLECFVLPNGRYGTYDYVTRRHSTDPDPLEQLFKD